MDLKSYLDSRPRGEAKRLAMGVNDYPSNISLWKSGKKSIPVSKCLLLESLTNGEVSRKELRPKDYRKYWPEL
ncbi:transcriptional regulator [Snodgrassella alvi]|uniref:transcriptional regulator n=1 Tax=Snodgrassella TaxID=1193515 RepID=UPI0018DC297C|nr:MULTISPECIES: YdaS family helix-turn-helix protein [Snodgrassella]MBI0164777.1 helix-turn-helix domain-containing protein [Snodgrassella sp. M0351]